MNKKNNYFSIDKKIIVITGASGQMGSEYAKVFLQEGALVIALDIHESQPMVKLKSLFPDFFTFIKTDITKKSDLNEALETL